MNSLLVSSSPLVYTMCLPVTDLVYQSKAFYYLSYSLPNGVYERYTLLMTLLEMSVRLPLQGAAKHSHMSSLLSKYGIYVSAERHESILNL